MKLRLTKLWLMLASLMFLPTAFAEPPMQYLEGVEYVRIATPQPVVTGDKIEVREIFMYACPHCFSFEPHLNAWLKKKPKNAELVRQPALFNPSLEPHARAYYVFETLGVLDKVHTDFFKAYHEKGQKLLDENSIAKFAAAHGVDEQRFRDTYKSFAVDNLVRQSLRQVPAYGVDSVPSIVVDGKYRTNGTFAGGNERLMDVVNFLVKKAALERKSKR